MRVFQALVSTGSVCSAAPERVVTRETGGPTVGGREVSLLAENAMIEEIHGRVVVLSRGIVYILLERRADGDLLDVLGAVVERVDRLLHHTVDHKRVVAELAQQPAESPAIDVCPIERGSSVVDRHSRAPGSTRVPLRPSSLAQLLLGPVIQLEVRPHRELEHLFGGRRQHHDAARPEAAEGEQHFLITAATWSAKPFGTDGGVNTQTPGS
eukprot:4380229-Prymnesium_polylepis.2